MEIEEEKKGGLLEGETDKRKEKDVGEEKDGN